jgi:hypothetical protein
MKLPLLIILPRQQNCWCGIKFNAMKLYMKLPLNLVLGVRRSDVWCRPILDPSMITLGKGGLLKKKGK